MINIKIKNYEIEGIKTEQYQEYEDAFLSYAEDKEGNPLTEEECEQWEEENPDAFFLMIYESLR